MPWEAADEKGPCRPQHLPGSVRETGLQVSDFSHWRLEGSACAGGDYISDGYSISEAFAGVATGSRSAPIVALDWRILCGSGIDAMVEVSLIFRFSRRQNSPG